MIRCLVGINLTVIEDISALECCCIGCTLFSAPTLSPSKYSATDMRRIFVGMHVRCQIVQLLLLHVVMRFEICYFDSDRLGKKDATSPYLALMLNLICDIVNHL